MIHTWLIILWRENGIALSELNVPPFFKAKELPPYEAVVEGVYIRCYKRASPIHLQTINSVYARLQQNYATRMLHTCKPSFIKSRLANGGKNLSQYSASAKGLISSSFSPRLCMICHWYFADPVLATSLLFLPGKNITKMNRRSLIWQMKLY